MNPHDISVNTHYQNLTNLISEAIDVAGYWNGDESGHLEDLAHIANDIEKKAEELRALLDEYAEISR